MVDWYIYAKDYSGSTSNSAFYHSNGLQTYYKFKEYVDNITTPKKVAYLHWDGNCVEVTESQCVEDYEKKIGQGYTSPKTIIQWIKDNAVKSIKLLYIITDGLIDSNSVDACVDANTDIRYEEVVFYAFNESQELDLSVVAPFLREKCKIYNNNELMDNIDISEDFDYDSINIDNFMHELEKIQSYIRLKFILTNNQALNEIEKLKVLRRRLLDEADVYERRKTANDLSIKDKNVLLAKLKSTKFYEKLTTTGALDLPVQVDKSITTLINYINTTKKSFAFNALKCTRQYEQHKIDEMDVDENITFCPHERIEFPDIILFAKDGIPVILLAELNLIEQIIFQNSDGVPKTNFANFSRLMSCPLFFLLNKQLEESIEYFYTFDVYKQLIATSTRIGPHTRKPFVGGIVLSKEFDAYNDYVLAATYFNSNKIQYNVGLFYYVLYKTCQSKNWMDVNVLCKFKEYVFRRMSETICRLGLTSLPLDPQENVTLTTALWYCVELSSHLFMDDENYFTHERMRMVFPVANYIIEILQYFEYDLDLDLINKRIEIFNNLSTLKRIFPHEERVYYILKQIFAQDPNGFLLAKIEHPENISKLNYLKVNHKKMIKTDDLTSKVDLNEFVCMMYCNIENKNVDLSEDTMRPFFVVGDHSFYVELMKSNEDLKINDLGQIYSEKINKLDFSKILSAYKLYINYVINEKKHPTFNDFTLYVNKKLKYKNTLIRLFKPNVAESLRRTFDNYQKIRDTFPVDYFITKAKDSVTRVLRIKMETPNLFDSDDEIKQFICNEEKKVK
ncbi:unnamed protein product [Brassicogethes aeneus]|uniref:P94 n=1 Tax=Brassicogethes aeneus TaxID=1431903 RepID=A0A9P0B999_BRAAE|nr:unnamed protein product [Brassicogethes aeneus]